MAPARNPLRTCAVGTVSAALVAGAVVGLAPAPRRPPPYGSSTFPVTGAPY